jgi:hypothetical protein
VEIQKLDLPVGTVTRVVPLGDVEQCSWSGYRPVALVPVEEFQSLNESGPNAQGSWQSTTRSERYGTIKVLMVLDAESALVQSQAASAEANTKAAAADRLASDLKAENEKLAKQNNELTKRVERDKVDASRFHKETSEAADRVRKMEADLGKVREAVGQIRMKEILGS